MSGTQLHKVLTNPKGGQRLGTSSATWNKIKQAAADPRNKPCTEESSKNDPQNPPALSKAKTHLVENGPNGEICIWYEAEQKYEIWGWQDVNGYSLYREQASSHDFYISAPETSSGCTSDTLSLLSQFSAPGRSVMAMTFMVSPNGPVFISAYTRQNRCLLEARFGRMIKEYVLPDFLQDSEISLKASSGFLVVSSQKGLLYILKFCPGMEEIFIDANQDGSLQSVYSHSSRALLEKYKVQSSSKMILLKTGTFDGAAIYDIVGTWLVYCPKRVETEYFKNLMHSNDDSPKDSSASGKKLYTSVKLPPTGPVLFRAASSLANSAIDKIFQLSQIGTKKMKSYWNPENSLFDKDISLHTISTSIGNALYSTASKIKKQADMIGENEIIKIIDLANGQIMATFKPPGGISHLSLSEYDLQLASATYRGDNFYIWDLCKLPNEVSFVGKFMRGKTSAVIKEIFWFVNNKVSDERQVTNSGFGCITKKTGSIHWYNINYLFCANENDNYPNTLEPSSSSVPKNGQFLDSWILPAMTAVKLLKLPGSSNVPNDGHEEMDTLLGPGLRRCNQLAFVDSSFNLRLVSPLNGKHTFKYKLNENPNENLVARGNIMYATWLPFSHAVGSGSVQNLDTPLSQTEIETCAPFSSITKDRNIMISSYVTGEKDGSFWDHFATFGNDVPTVVHEFSGILDYDTPLTSTDDLTGHLNDGLVISSGNEE